MNISPFLWIPVLAFAISSCKQAKQEPTTDQPIEQPTMTLQQQIDRFVPTNIGVEQLHLSPRDERALDKIIEAAQCMDQIYFRQVWSGNPSLLVRMNADTSAHGKELLHYLRLNMGPWSTLDHDKPFVPGIGEHPKGANYYPENMASEEFTAWINGLSPHEREQATGFFTVIHRDARGALHAVPYSEEYRPWLLPAAKKLTEAARLTTNKSLKKYLLARAQAFLSNDYYKSDVAWMELNSPIDVTIGPYETYMDELFNYKAAFEAFVTIQDKAETEKLTRFSSYLQDIENHLPIDPKDRNPKLAAMSPIRVVDVVYAAGEGNRGVQTAAYNLPNDERILREKGTKRVLLKNMQEAKFQHVLVPIASVVLDSSQLGLVSFDAFFTHILAHELMHGLGPHNITVNGQPTTVRKELKELYSALEEAKADITGLFALQYLIDKGLLEKSLEAKMYATYLASMFRSTRFGTHEAHGMGVVMQFNYLTIEGGIVIDPIKNKFSIDPSKIKDAVAKLTGEIMTLQAEGSYKKTKIFCDKYAIIHPAMQQALDALQNIPVDIAPLYGHAPKTQGEIR